MVLFASEAIGKRDVFLYLVCEKKRRLQVVWIGREGSDKRYV